MDNKEDIRKTFGNYFLLDVLKEDERSKHFRAKYLGVPDKIVTLKKLNLSSLDDQDTIDEFIHTIKTSFGLNHPNIVMFYDYGKYNEELFYATEYVDGKTISDFQKRLREKRYLFPLEISLSIVTRICQALQYTHQWVDQKTGEKKCIVHGAVSLENISINYDGQIKLTGFGNLATLVQNNKERQVDEYFDQYALAVVLWEMLCHRRISETIDQNLLELPAPSTINPLVPKALDQVVLKALSLRPEDRFRDMATLGVELSRVLYSNFPNFNPNDISCFAMDLFQDEFKSDRDKFYEWSQIDLRPYIKEYNQRKDKK